MSDQKPENCPDRGAIIPADAPEGICPQCPLLQGVAAPVDRDTPAPETALTIESVAAVFSKLEIVEPIARGGMGHVFKAHQPDLDRVVALKVLALAPDGGASPEFHERVLREARAMAKLEHPNIVAIHEFGETGGFYYFLMEFVEGESLAQRLRRTGKLDAGEANRIIADAAAALEFAHEQGIVHRDVKPGNILLGGGGRVKVADFGLAKILYRDSGVGFSLTLENQVVGTPYYMAPEQRNDSSSVDHRADVYGLGVVLYEMLTGRPPELNYEAPSDVVDVDARYNDLVRAATESSPDKRLPSARAFRERLQAIQSEAPPAPAMSEDQLPIMGHSSPPRKKWSPFHVLAKRWPSFLLGALGTVGLIFGIAYAITAAMPREYLGRVRLQVPLRNFEVFRENTTQTMMSPTFIQTPFQIIASKETLYEVVDRMDLVNRWDEVTSKPEAYRLLLDKIEVEEVRGTDLIDIEVHHGDPHEAAELADVIAAVYSDHRSASERQRNAAALETQYQSLKSERESVRNSGLGVQHPEVVRLEKSLEEMLKILEKGAGAAKIHELAEPDEMPAKPRVKLQLAIGAAVGLLLAIPGGVIFAYIVHAVRRA